MAKKRKAGQGSVHLRKDGRWEGRYVIGYDEFGLPKTKNVLAYTKTECQQKLKKLKEECGGAIKSEKLKTDMRFGTGWITGIRIILNPGSVPVPSRNMRSASISTSFRSWETSR